MDVGVNGRSHSFTQKHNAHGTGRFCCCCVGLDGFLLLLVLLLFVVVVNEFGSGACTFLWNVPCRAICARKQSQDSRCAAFDWTTASREGHSPFSILKMRMVVLIELCTWYGLFPTNFTTAKMSTGISGWPVGTFCPLQKLFVTKSVQTGLTNTHTNTHKHTQTHTNTHKHTQTHTNTHTHTQSPANKQTERTSKLPRQQQEQLRPPS